MAIRALLDLHETKPADLPHAGPQRWVPGKKAAVLAAIQTGTLSIEEACKRYFLTPEELQSWHQSFAADGVAGLKMKRLAERRTAARRKVSEPARAMLDNGDQLDCMITDIGSQGARLEFPIRLLVPRRFNLQCRRSERSIRVSVKWQREGLAGVQFEEPNEARLCGANDLGAWLLGEG